MTLNEFVNHIKHNSLALEVRSFCIELPDYHGTIGSYKCSVYKSVYGSIDVETIVPSFKDDDTFKVTLNADDAQKYIDVHRREIEEVVAVGSL